MPLSQDPSVLGNSNQRAFRMLHSIENKFQTNPKLEKLYRGFTSEYENLGHMSQVVNTEDFPFSYYLSHHGVINENSTTTKLRVVFNASAKTSNGISLNDIQFFGPRIQEDIFSLLLKLRQHKVVVCSDIVKMYRQILIEEGQRCLQLILWRDTNTNQVVTFQLNTLTYGTASAPWLATRCLKQLSDDFMSIYPEAARIIAQNSYIDDLIFSVKSDKEAKEICDQISFILSSAGFSLQKWTSNSESVLKYVKHVNPEACFNFRENGVSKTLGVYWLCSSDVFMFNISNANLKTVTKRSILSDISQIFDPLGFLAPCVITVKILLQRLWKLKLKWDESLPSELDTRWRDFRRELVQLNELRIDRQAFCSNYVSVQVHGFADAAKEAFGACVFVRSEDSVNNIKVRLLCARTRVAPIKSKTIPRLELCAALLLAELMDKVKKSIDNPFNTYFYWSDSSVCLSWIKNKTNVYPPFIQNRILKIHNLTDSNTWYHVQSNDNPADLLSRGISCKTILHSKLWWEGPTWLSKRETSWPKPIVTFRDESIELKNQINYNLITPNKTVIDFKRFSNLLTLQRTFALCLRFVNKMKGSLIPDRQLTTNELNLALTKLVKISQSECFFEEIKLLQQGKELPINSKILNLNPFLDSEGILRVGGRLDQSNFNYEKKHPALLDSNHYLTTLIFKYEHYRLLHAGPQQLLFSVRDKYWPMSGKKIAKKVVHSCLKCFRIKPIQASQIMGVLPSSRVTPAPVFSTTGVDYAGPFLIKDRKGRGAKTSKCYICLFICFTTKCVHIELVTDLSTDTFLAAFRRFCSRRGIPTDVYSDNGSTFKGAKNELDNLYTFLIQNEFQLKERLSNLGINWHFIPAFSPNYGGLWEAGIKSTKSHLKRIFTNSILTYEELLTVLVEIEAVLNSRPLTPLSSDPRDLSALTPSHFLIGLILTSLPSPDLKDLPINRLNRFQYLQQIQQHFWNRWSKEFISELQTRVKWKQKQPQLTVDTLVLIKDDNLPPLRWKLGRVMSVIPGPDGFSRVAVIKTVSGIIKRSLSKLCPLPVIDQ